jgi:hypothetical protein
VSELFVVGDFDDPYGKDAKGKRAKLDAIANDLWEPDGDDFALVAQQAGAGKKPPTARDVFGLLKLIVDLTQKGSLEKLHIISHGRPGLVALRGSIRLSQGGMGKAQPFLGNGLDEESMQSACDRTIPGAKDKIYISDVRGRFSKSAQIILYACHGGSARAGPDSPPSPELGRAIAEFFNVSVVTFNDVIAYCPNPLRGEIRSAVGSCKDAEKTVRNITKLVSLAGNNAVTCPKPSTEKLWGCSERPPDEGNQKDAAQKKKKGAK